jgi:uncharacterized protein (TIRG00374 family)
MTIFRRYAALIAKLLVSVMLLAYLVWTTDIHAIVRRVREGDPLLFAVAAILFLCVLGISTWRWGLMLRALGYPAPLRQLSASYLAATFFNNFLPSNIGGDVVRVRDGKELTGSTTTSLAVVAIDRVVGFGGLYVLAALAFALGGPTVRHLAGARVVVFGLGVGFLVLAYIFFHPGTTRRLMAAFRLSKFPWAQERFDVVQGAVHVYRENVRAVWLALAASVLLQAVFVLYFYAVARALDIPLPLAACFLMVPLCLLIQAVPISFNGWGVRESVFILYFAQIHLPRESALAFSLVGAGLIVLLSLSGAVVWTAREPPSSSAPGTTP